MRFTVASERLPSRNPVGSLPKLSSTLSSSSSISSSVAVTVKLWRVSPDWKVTDDGSE